MKTLLNGCTRSEMSISPKNWKSTKAPMRKKWKIFYRFYDPVHRDRYPGGRDMAIRTMNKYKDLSTRQQVTQSLLDNELQKLDEDHWNPITEQYMTPVIQTPKKPPKEIMGSTPLIEALEKAFKKIVVEPSWRADIKSVLKYFTMSAAALSLDKVPIENIDRGDIISILDNCENLTVEEKRREGIVHRQKVWNYNQFNHYRKCIHSLYEYMELIEAVKYNPVTKIPVKSDPEGISQKETIVLTPEERREIDAELLEKHPAFRRFIHIFFHSGSRRTEMMRVRGKDVFLERQRFFVTIKKGGVVRRVRKTIKDVAMPFWEEAMKGCGPEDYVFSLNFEPGPRAVGAQLPTRWWRRLVKPLGIQVDFYKLKHLNSTETTSLKGEDVAAAQNSHTTTAMVRKIYDVEQDEREHQQLKQVNNTFA